MNIYKINQDKVLTVESLIEKLKEADPKSYVCFSLGEKLPNGGEQGYYLNGLVFEFANGDAILTSGNDRIIILVGSNGFENLKEIKI